MSLPSTSMPVAEDDKCEDAQNTYILYKRVMIPVSVVFLILLSFLVKRKRLCVACCNGRPGILHPVNFIDSVDRRWPFAVCYVSVIVDIIQVIVLEEQMTGEGWTTWSIRLMQILEVIVTCLIAYPLFACLTHSHHIAANVIGFLQSATMFALMIFVTAKCTNGDNTESLSAAERNKYIYTIVTQLPILVTSGLLMLIYLYDLGRNILICFCNNTASPVRTVGWSGIEEVAQNDDISKDRLLYVFQLLHKKQKRQNSPENAMSLREVMRYRLHRITKYLVYRKVLGFRYPLRLICTMTICFFFLCMLVVGIQYTVNSWSEKAEMLLSRNREFFVNLFHVEVDFEEHLRILRVSATVANVLSGVLHILFIVHIVITYKKRTVKYFRGHHKLHKKLRSNPTTVLIRAMSYPGYQLVAFIYGWMFTAVVMFVLIMLFVYAIVIPIRDNKRNFLANFLIEFCFTALVSTVLYIGQYLICRFLCLQDRGRVLALQNRKFFHVMSYFSFTLNIVVGVVVCTKRLVLAFISSTILMSRLDFVFLVRGFESFDPGHLAYMSMVVLDVCQNHPVMRSFVDLLKHQSRQQPMTDVEMKKKRIRNRWLKLRTLINNPSLVFERLRSQDEEAMDITDKSNRIYRANAWFNVMRRNPNSVELFPLNIQSL